MRPAVTVILVARNGAHVLERTISALEGQTRAPDRIAMVNIDSRDATREIMRDAEPDLLLSLPEDTSFGEAVREAAAELDGIDEGDAALLDDGWLWLLGADNSPEHDALEELLATVERNPSLEVTGPKQVRRDDPAVIVEYGQSMTRGGRSVVLHQGELDQGQFERLSDVLAVGAGGMLVRRSTWRALGGFDPGLPVVDDALDFCERVWLSGGRVLLTPSARVERDGDPATLLSPSGERMPASQRIRERRKAELHRRLSSSSGLGFLLHWLGLLPSAIARGLSSLLRKVPGRILPELGAALAVMFGRTGAAASRRRFAATRTEPLAVIDRLRISAADERRHRELRAEQLRARVHGARREVRFLETGGGWVVLAGLLASALLFLPLLNAGALRGGALLPLSTIGELWSNTGYGVRDEGLGALGPADPFALVLALLGTLTFWQPSLSIVALWVLAMPIAALGGWLLAARLTVRPWLRAIAGFGWMLAPPLLVALADGRLPAVLVHLALPFLVLAGIQAVETWRGVATMSLLGALVAACSPSLIPALLVLWLLAIALGGRTRMRLLAAPVPALALFLPLVVAQLNRGRPLGLLADPGLAAPYAPVTGPAVLLGFPEQGFGGWSAFLGAAGSAFEAPVALAMLAAPVALCALLGLVGPRYRTAAVGLVLAALGAATAILAGGIAPATIASTPVLIWIGAGQSLMALGLGGAALAGLAVARRGAMPLLALLALVGLAGMAWMPATAASNGRALVAEGAERTVPAIVEAQGNVEPLVGTLILTPMGPDELRMVLDRGTGQTLDAQSTLRTTASELSPEQRRLAEVVVNLVSDHATAPTAELHALGVSYVLLAPPEADATGLASRLSTSLDANGALASAGGSGYGSLWQVVNATVKPADPVVAERLDQGGLGTWAGRGILAAQLLVLLAAVLLALPTGTLEADAALAERPARRRWGSLDGEGLPAARPIDFGDVAGERLDPFAAQADDADEVMAP
ncbi:hypothetical protein USB125703_01063 [Pseudoclavibacter triregionum]|nr:hypothetical protein USB125703_01063 [Pseudoclavibacter triregionum]